MQSWQLQDAKARLSEVLKEASLHGPQEITLRGKPAVVVISTSDYQKLTQKSKPSFITFLRQSPLTKIHLVLKRDPSKTREVDL